MRASLNILGLCLSMAVASGATAAQYLAAGHQLVLKDRGTSQKLVYESNDPVIQAPTPGGADDPTAVGATFTISANGIAHFDLPSGNWIVKQTSAGPLFKFRNPDAPGGPSPVRSAVLRAGFVKVKAASTGILVDGALLPAVRLDAGTSAWCSSFDGHVTDNRQGLFIAKKQALPPATCTPLEITTTTLDTTTTTSSTTTTIPCTPKTTDDCTSSDCGATDDGCGGTIDCLCAQCSGLCNDFGAWASCDLLAESVAECNQECLAICNQGCENRGGCFPPSAGCHQVPSDFCSP